MFQKVASLIPLVWWCSLTSCFAPVSVYSFISKVRRSIEIPHENGAFSRGFSNRRDLKTPALSFNFVWTEKK